MSKEINQNFTIKKGLETAAYFAFAKFAVLAFRQPFVYLITKMQAEQKSAWQILSENSNEYGYIKSFLNTYSGSKVAIMRILTAEVYRGFLTMEFPRMTANFFKKHDIHLNRVWSNVIACIPIAAIDSFIMTPLSLIMTKQMLAKNSEDKKLLSIYSQHIKDDAFTKTLQKAFRGYGAMYGVMLTHWWSFMVMDGLIKSGLEQRYSKVEYNKLFVANIFGAFVQASILHPFDAIRIRMQNTKTTEDMFTITKKFVAQYGLKGLYKGFGARFFGINSINYMWRSFLIEYLSKPQVQPVHQQKIEEKKSEQNKRER